MEKMDGAVSKAFSGFGTFFVPGPTEVRTVVLRAMTHPMIPHRSDAFEELFARLQIGLKKMFRTGQPVFICACSSTGLMEAGVRCTPPGKILALVNGAFSERFARIAEMCGRSVDRYVVDWGKVHKATELDKLLSQGEYRAITVVHSETSTGALNDIRTLSDMAHSHRVVCLVDSVSGLGGAKLEMDDWGLDYVLTGSQKALAVPPGLAFAAASNRFLEAAVEAESRGVYFDVVEMNEFARRGQVPSTPAVSLLFALEVQLESIATEGIEARWTRHAEMARMTSAWVAECRQHRIDIENIVEPAHRSPTVSTIRLPDGLESAKFVSRVASKGITVATGYGKLKASTFRIGHMGDHSPQTLKRCLNACRWALEQPAS